MTLADMLAGLERDGYLLLPGYLDADRFGSCGLLNTLKTTFYPPLARIANHWSEQEAYPPQLAALQARCREAGRALDPSRYTHLREQEHQPLRQSPTAFPLLLCALLCTPGKDFSGGDLLLTEHRPRLQSRPIVVPLRRGDIAIIPAGRRPVRHSRVTTRHAISRVRSGERLGLELFFDLL